MFDRDCLVSFAAVTCLKFLFIPLYKSTDFEVHRNWMAITYQKQLEDWYFEETSEWTLDYPPLFAWFEYGLAHLAKFFDPKMLIVTNINYSSPQTVFFMRLSVILSDIIYFYGVNRICRLVKDRQPFNNDPWIKRDVVLATLLLWNPGLLLVDHIHFQYNGFLSGILFISIADMLEEKYVNATFWFSVLLNLKHIYLYLAPAYFLFLLKYCCCKKTHINESVSLHNFSFIKAMKLLVAGIFPLLLSFGPFIYMGQLKQVLSRLFPVKRGLTHSYWAPNIWALYNFTDNILAFFASQLGIYSEEKRQSCVTKGLVQECEHIILPSISAKITVVLALISMVPVFWLIWKKAYNLQTFVNSVVLCAFGSFMFGYHVHEKAVLLIILPMTVSAVFHKEEAKIYTFLAIIGHYSLFPLLYREGETLLKILLLLHHSVYTFSCLTQLHRLKTPLINTFEEVYLYGIVFSQVYYSVGAEVLGLETKLPFLSLMLISVYCAIGMLYAWFKYCAFILDIEIAAKFKSWGKNIKIS